MMGKHCPAPFAVKIQIMKIPHMAFKKSLLLTIMMPCAHKAFLYSMEILVLHQKNI